MLALAALALAAACDSIDDVDPVTGVTTIEVRDNEFTPRVIEVEPGTEVTWEFVGGDPHNLVGAEMQGQRWIETDPMREGTVSHVFQVPGPYDYECTLHAGMTGRVVVTDPR